MNSIVKVLLVAVLGFALLAVPLHFWLVDRHAFLRAVYGIQAPVARLSATCSEGAPGWLAEMTSQGIDRLKALSTQVALIDRQGKRSHCETGWESTMLLSSRVDEDTRFRYGSMTKLVTAAKVVSLVREDSLSFDSTLGEVFSVPGEEGSVSRVTVGQLLRHRSGIMGHVFSSEAKPVCPYRLNDLISSGEVSNGGQLQYSNLGYCVLGEVIAEVTGEPYRAVMESSYNLSARNIDYVGYEEAEDEVERDFRFNDFYGRNLKGRFDYNAISSTAGMSGSASAYALLLNDLIEETAPTLFQNGGCDSRAFKRCYDYAFYEYSPTGDAVYRVKEGYLPGAAGVVVVNEDREIFVWLGNSDTENAAAGDNMKQFLAKLAEAGF